MFKNLVRVGLLSAVVLATFTSCEEEQQFTNEKLDAKRVEVQVLNSELAKVRDYVPLYAVIAHRGSTFWAPEETEASWRWAREMGADYLESDVQCTKDGIVLANHDENLKRTTNIENVFSETVPASRVDFYMSLGFSRADAEAQYGRDIAAFRPFYTLSYYYAELLMLDAGSWFNESSLEQARPTFKATENGRFENGKIVYSNGLYISAIQDQIAYAQGKRLIRDAEGRRILTYKIKDELRGLHAKNVDVIWPLLNLDKITENDGKLEGLAEQVEALQKSDAYLFDLNTGSNRGGAAGTPEIGNNTSVNDAVNQAIRALSGRN